MDRRFPASCMRRSSVFLFGLPALPRIFFKSETETEFVPVDILIYSEDGKVRPISGRGLGSTPAVQMGSGMEARNRTAPHQIIPDQDTAYQITRDRSAKDGASAETRDRPPSPALARSPRSVESQESSTRTETARTEITRTETAKAEPSETKPKNATANEPKPPNWKTPSSRIKDQLGTASMTAITDKKKSAQVRDNSARDKSQSAMSTLPADPRLEFLLATLVAGDDRLKTAVAPHTTQPRTFHTREVTSAVRVRKTAERHYPHAENNQARRYWRGEERKIAARTRDRLCAWLKARGGGSAGRLRVTASAREGAAGAASALTGFIESSRTWSACTDDAAKAALMRLSSSAQ